MKKNLIYTLAFAAVISLISSCAKEENNPVVEQGKQITISASFPEDATKVVFNECDYDNPKLTPVWQSGDVITITDTNNESNSQTFTLESGAGTSSATFKGTALQPATSYTISYNGAGSFDFANQVQADDGTTDHLKYIATLSGVSDYTNFSFSESWAAANGATFTPSSVLRLRVKLPGALEGNVKAVIFKAGANIFAGANEMTVNLTAYGNPAEDGYLNIFATLPAGNQAIDAGTDLVIQFQVSDKAYDKYTAYRKLPAMIIKAGKMNTLSLNCETIDKYANASNTGIGTSSNPYLIGDQHQMALMASEMVEEAKVYFKMVDDIDMTGVDWEPLNYAEPYKKYVNFDGQNFAIQNLSVGKGTRSDNYPSLFGVLYGECKNLIIDNADINVKSNYKAGILAGYLGTLDAFISCNVSNVTIRNSKIGSDGTSTRSMGVFVGQVPTADATITNCHVLNSTITQLNAVSSNHTGGFIGYSQKDATYTDCTTEAVVNGKQFSGGFVGYGGMGTFTRCYASGRVSGTKDVGGFVGKTENPSFIDCKYTGSKVTASDNSKNAHPGGFVGYAAKTSASVGAIFSGCYVDGAEIDATSSQRVGGFVGQVDVGNTFTKCYVKNITMSSSTNSGGFVGVDYTAPSAAVPGAGIYKCYVEGCTLTAKGNNCGGFVGYPQNATITNCYVTSSVTVNGGTYGSIGGFTGNEMGNNTISYCYEAASVTGTGSGVGAFIGSVGYAPTSVTKCIAWNGSQQFYGATSVDVGGITDNYTGTSGTISSQATSLGWDGSVWNLTGDVPTLK